MTLMRVSVIRGVTQDKITSLIHSFGYCTSKYFCVVFCRLGFFDGHVSDFLWLSESVSRPV
jgi:hypothetical protein